MRTVTIEHGWYGCETGCCGTEVRGDEDGKEVWNNFEFSHTEPEDAETEAKHQASKRGWTEFEIVVEDLKCYN